MAAFTELDDFRLRDSVRCVQGFLLLLPTIRDYALWAFRYFGSEAQEEAVAEVVANAYTAYVALIARSKADLIYPTVLARYAIRHFYYGRRVGSRFSTQDVASRAAQRRHGFVVERLDYFDEVHEQWTEGIVADRATPVPEQVAFRCDFPNWLARQSRRNRRVVECLSLGHATADVARRFHVTASRVSQLRRELHRSWRAFQRDSSHE